MAMLFNWEPYPKLKEAVIIIAADNGVINRLEPKEQMLEKVGCEFARAGFESSLLAAEIELTLMTRDRFYDVLTGDQGGEQSVSDALDTVLELAFESM